MKMMKIANMKYAIGKLMLAAVWPVAMLLGGCDSDEPASSPAGGTTGMNTPGEGIVVCGGNGDLVAQTRFTGADDTSGPGVEGTCRADLLEIYPFFLTSGYTTYWPEDNEYNYQEADEAVVPYVSVASPIPLKIMGRDGYTEAGISIEKDRDYIYMYNTALAYTEADKSKFTTNIANRTSSTLSLNGAGTSYVTPELYYGTLGLKEDSYNPAPSVLSVWESNDDDDDPDENEYMWYYNHLSVNKGSASLTGRIFRIVSQVNLTITDIPAGEVSSIELYADHFPTQITLNGTHGSYYPVHAVTDPANTTQNDSVLLARTDISPTAESAKLSSFLLPSEVGMRFWVKISYTGESSRDRVFDLRPQTSHYLTGNDAAVYNVGSDLKHGSDLYVYNGNAGKFCFYSYSNVRVNLSGRFDNIAVDTSEPNIEIVVNPNFEDEHNFDII